MMPFTIKDKIRSFLRRVFVLVFWILVWQIIASIVGKEVLLPSPGSVLHRLWTLLLQKEFYLTVFASIGRILAGYVLGCVFGILFAILCFQFPVAEILFSPVFSIIRSVPVASFIILALVWIGRDFVPTFIAFLMVLPIVYGNVREGMQNADKKLFEVAVVYEFNRLELYRYLYLPSAFPYFQSAAFTALGMSWKAGVAAEVLCSLHRSIGGQIFESKLYLETDSLLAWTITVILLSIAIEKAVISLFSNLTKRRTK